MTTASQIRGETPKEKKAAAKRSKGIDKYLQDEAAKRDAKKTLVLLLLGPADSGKTTVFRQMIMLNGKTFSAEERAVFKSIIHSSILRNIMLLINAAPGAQLNVKMTVDLMKLLPEQMISQETWDRIQIAWQDPAVQEAYKTRELIPGFIDNYDYFYNKMDKIIQPEYVPSDDDILMCRQTSDLVTETFVDVGEKLINIIDVAGQEDKRMKWAPLFEKNVSAIIYVLSCVSYCQMMEENTSKNKLLDAFELYDQLVQHPILKPKNFIVFLNKVDLLPNRLAAYAPQSFLPDYVGQRDPKSLIEYIRDSLNKITKNLKLNVFYHRTNATDTQLMRKVTQNVQEVILRAKIDEIYYG